MISHFFKNVKPRDPASRLKELCKIEIVLWNSLEYLPE